MDICNMFYLALFLIVVLYWILNRPNCAIKGHYCIIQRRKFTTDRYLRYNFRTVAELWMFYRHKCKRCKYECLMGGKCEESYTSYSTYESKAQEMRDFGFVVESEWETSKYHPVYFDINPYDKNSFLEALEKHGHVKRNAKL